jgi:hypothetical protein
LSTGLVRPVFGHDGAGFGAISLHPSGLLLALAERAAISVTGVQTAGSAISGPRITLIELPSLNVTKELKGGTERSYSDIAFSATGDKLVSVGGFPDFMLSVWNWRNGEVLLKTKAFGQEVHLSLADCETH